MLEKILEFVYPSRCIICDKVLEFNSFEKKEFTCNNCKKKLEYKREGNAFRQVFNMNFDYLLSIFSYKDIVRKLLLDFKFNEKKYLKYFFSNELVCALEKNQIKQIDYIIFVPISVRRYFERGYNQSKIVAIEISKYLQIPIVKNVLRKVKHNKRQSELSIVERVNNTKNVYKVYNKEIIKGKGVLLIDDIYTTGNTVNECSRVLKEAGVKTIFVATIAKAK